MRRLLLAVLISLSLVRAAAAVEPVEITLWHQLNYAERVVLAEQLKRFHKMYPWIKVTAIYRETEQLRAGFQNSALGGSGPELVHGPSDQIGPFATMGIIKPMETLLDTTELKRLDPQALVWYQGHLYQVADRLGNHLCLIYNKALVPDPPKNSDEMIRIGQKNTVDENGDGRTDRFGLVWNFTEPYFFVPFLSGFGGWMIDDNAHPTLNTEANRRALQFVKDLRDKYKITPQNSDYELAHNLFMEGKAAMIINGDWSWQSYVDAGIDIGVTRIPKIVATGLWPAPIVSPRGFSVNVNIKKEKIEPTLILLRFLLSDQTQRTMAAGTGIMPSSKNLRNDPVITNNPIMRGSLYQIQVAKPMPIVPELRA
ncbi:MAG: extracellular solute-binding protein, partial [bacterium]